MRGDQSGFFLGFRVERFGNHLAPSLLEEDFHFAFSLLEVFLAVSRKLHAFLKQLHGVIERQICAVEFTHDFLEACEAKLKFGLFRWFRLLGCRRIRGRHVFKAF